MSLKYNPLRNSRGQAMTEWAFVATAFFFTSLCSVHYLFAGYQKNAFYLAAKAGVSTIVTTRQSDPALIRNDAKAAIEKILKAHGRSQNAARNIADNAVIEFNQDAPDTPVRVVVTDSLWMPISNFKRDGQIISFLVSAEASTFQNHYGPP